MSRGRPSRGLPMSSARAPLYSTSAVTLPFVPPMGLSFWITWPLGLPLSLRRTRNNPTTSVPSSLAVVTHSSPGLEQNHFRPVSEYWPSGRGLAIVSLAETFEPPWRSVTYWPPVTASSGLSDRSSGRHVFF